MAVDRYSEWPVVVKCREDSSEELGHVLRGMFCVYGAPKEFAMDGALVFLSGTTQKILETWGV